MSFSLSAAGHILIEVAADVDPQLDVAAASAEIGARVLAAAESKEKEIAADFAAVVHKHRDVFSFASFKGSRIVADILADADKIKDEAEKVAAVLDPPETGAVAPTPSPTAAEAAPAASEAAPVDPTGTAPAATDTTGGTTDGSSAQAS